MAYQKVPRPSTVYHLTKKEHLDSILDDGVIRRFDDTECWFCESLDKMRAYMAQTVLCEGKSYYAVGGQLCRYPKFVPEDYVLLKLTPRGYEDNWYRWNQEIPPDSPKELARAAREFSLLKIGYRGDMAFKEPEVIDVPKFLSGEIVSHNYIEKLLFAMRTTWSSETTKAVDYTVVRCLFRCHRYKTNYIKEVTPCCQTRTPKTPISFLLLIC